MDVDGGAGRSAWIKDYDAVEPPTRWLNQGWDISNWIVISAFSCSERIGGAVIAWKTAGVDFLEGRDDVAVLWDIRVAPAWRRKGIGSVLFRRAIELATIWDCSELKIETQDINAPACRFYAKQGCRLVSVEADAYPDFPQGGAVGFGGSDWLSRAQRLGYAFRWKRARLGNGASDENASQG